MMNKLNLQGGFMKHLVVITVTLLLGTVGLHALMNTENHVQGFYTQEIEYPYHELHEVLFAENRSETKTEETGDYVIEKKIIPSFLCFSF